jgi:PAS domain S-box-containing protein
MRTRLRKQRSRIRSLSAMMLLTLLVVAFFILLIGGRALKTQIDRLAVTSSDNLGWNISQVDVDFKNFSSSLLQPMTPSSPDGTDITPAEFSNIQKAFDIYYSRVNIIGATLTRIGTPYASSDDYKIVLKRRDEFADIVDAMNAPTREEIQELYVFVASTEPSIRTLTTRGIQSLSKAQSDIREQQYNTFLRFHASSFIILGFVLLACLLAFRLWRDLEERSRNVEMAATNATNAFEAAQSAVIFTDADGIIIQCNQAATKYFGKEQEDILGVDFIRGLLDSESFEQFIIYRKSPGTHTIQLLARSVDYKPFPIEMSGVWTKDVEGLDTYIIYLKDISARLAAEEKLKTSRDEAKEASNAKSRFLATMSHEMRTPLHGLIASLDMIEANKLTQADQKLFKTALECSNRALEQVTSILDHTRLTRATETPQPFALRAVLEDIQTVLTPLATANENTLDINFLGAGADARYIGLPEAFSRVIYNLLGNAIKFTHKGAITVDMIASKGNSENTRLLNFVVSDQGIGIAKEDHARIFESFEKAKFNEDDSTKGSGLGLSIVKHSLKQMDSQVHMTSRPGKGSTFKFTLELELSDESETLEASADPLPTADTLANPNSNGPVLIVDDNEINRTVLREMVSRLGYEAHCVALGSEAVTAANDTEYALILMDVNMPGMDGYEATRAIRAGTGKSEDAVILGVTALIPSDRDHSTESGMDAMLAKPLTADRLARAVKKYIGQIQVPTCDDLEKIMDPAIAKKLKLQSITDARNALKVLVDGTSSWEDRRDAAHYAVGSTGVVGFNQLSQTLVDAENAAKQSDQDALDKYTQELTKMLVEK